LRHRAAPPAAPSAVAIATTNAAPSAVAPESTVVNDTAPEPTPSAESTAESASNSASAVAHAEAKPSSASALSAELNALDTARSALAGGNPSAALSDLDQYAHQFPHGKLGLEAEVVRIEALAKSGQTATAKKRAQAFMKRHPDSLLASRVRAYAEQ
jgi:hypothetical protein